MNVDIDGILSFADQSFAKGSGNRLYAISQLWWSESGAVSLEKSIKSSRKYKTHRSPKFMNSNDIACWHDHSSEQYLFLNNSHSATFLVPTPCKI